MGERFITANGITIWTEDFGNPSEPPVLLIMGAGTQGIFWAEEFCAALVEGGRYVIRYDNRDTGQSTCFDFGASPYTVHDMAFDAVGVLDAYGIGAAHLVGASMGGMIAQQVALEFPDRVLSLTSFMSSPAGAMMSGRDCDPPLPGPTPAVMEAIMARMAGAATTSRAERIEAQLRLFRALTGTFSPFDEEHHRRLEERAVDRAVNPDAAANHGLAVEASPDRTRALAGVTAPTLVIHGTADPIFPYEHGVATARAIRGAKLVAIEGLGHEMPPAAFGQIARLILDHSG